MAKQTKRVQATTKREKLSSFKKSAQDIESFQNKLLEWFGSNGRHFPWRVHGLSDYEIILTEILLQRTKAETVSNYYSWFFSRLNSWEVLAQASETDLEGILRPLGLSHQKSKRLFALAQQIKKKNYQIPFDIRELESLPMMGQYIVNSVKLLVFKQNSPLLDVNMARLLERYFGPRQRADIRYDVYLQKLAHDVVTHEQSKELNWAILDFAAIVCKGKPKCFACVLLAECSYREKLFNK